MLDPRDLPPEASLAQARRLGANGLAVRRLSRPSWARESTTRGLGARFQVPRRLSDRSGTLPRLALDGDGHVAASTASRSSASGPHDGLAVETVLIPLHKPGAVSVCLSSQVGCAMGCVFCATARMPHRRNLATWEIVDQWVQARDLARSQGRRVTGAVFMGMGEPFLNYDRVLAAAELLCCPYGGAVAGQGDHDQHRRPRPRDRPLHGRGAQVPPVDQPGGRHRREAGPARPDRRADRRWPRSWPPPAATPWPAAGG